MSLTRGAGIALLLVSADAFACECKDTHGGWPTGRKGVPRTVRPLVLDARPDARYALLDIGPSPEQPDALTPVLLPLDAPERWDRDSSLPRWPEPRSVVPGRLKHLRNQVPRIFEFIPDKPLPARHRFMLVADPEPKGVLAVFETGDGTTDDSEPLERVDLEQYIPPPEIQTSCAEGWNVVLREVPRRVQPRLLEVLPANPLSADVPVTLLMSFDGRISAGLAVCSPWGLSFRRRVFGFESGSVAWTEPWAARCRSPWMSRRMRSRGHRQELDSGRTREQGRSGSKVSGTFDVPAAEQVALVAP